MRKWLRNTAFAGGGLAQASSSSDFPGCSQTVTINVTGMKFETSLENLEQFPRTLLGDPEKRKKFYDPARNEYYFNRNRPSFDAIFRLYTRGGTLQRPFSVPIDVFTEEIKFFELGDTIIERLGSVIAMEKCRTSIVLPKGDWQRKLWLLVEYPMSSTGARIFALFSAIAILTSVCNFCINTLPSHQYYMLLNSTSRLWLGNFKLIECQTPRFHDEVFIIDTACVSWFIIELILRFGSSPKKLTFFLNGLNFIDLVAIVPYFLQLAQMLQEDCGSKSSMSLPAFKAIRLSRVVVLFKVYGHSKGIQTLVSTLKSSMREISLLIFFLIMSALLFSSAIYYVDGEEPDSPFHSIPESCWWAVITMTTVGYGDMMPVGVGGKIVGAFCALSGAFSLALFLPAIVANFNYHWQEEREDIYKTDYMRSCAEKVNEEHQQVERLHKEHLKEEAHH